MTTFSGRGDCVYTLADTVSLIFLSDLAAHGAGKLSRLKALRGFIRMRSPDVIISFLPHVNCSAILSAWGLKIPVIACERTYPPLANPPLPRLYRVLRTILYPHAAALVAQTGHTAEWLRQQARRPEIAVIANPIVLPMPDAEPKVSPGKFLGAHDKLILWVGRMDDAKRPAIMIDAFRRIGAAAHGWKLALLGDGPLRESLQGEVNAAGLSDRIYFPGFIGDLSSWYKRSDIYVTTSEGEGFPNSLLEAMAHDVASIAFDIRTGPSELSDNGRRLMLLPDDNHVERLAAAIDTLITDNNKRAKFAHWGSEIRSAYSLPNILTEWDALLRKIGVQTELSEDGDKIIGG